mgnify:CR=1 FL=1
MSAVHRVTAAASAILAAVTITAATTTGTASAVTGPLPGNGPSGTPFPSKDGRYVAFISFASNLVPGDTNNDWDVFIRDTVAKTTRLVSKALTGAGLAAISADGRYLAVTSRAPLVAGDTNGMNDAYRFDTATGALVRASVTSTGGAAPDGADAEGMSSDGRYVLFSSPSTLTPGDTNGRADIYVRDLVANTTKRVSTTPTGAQFTSDSREASISPNGRWIAWTVNRNGYAPDAYKWDRNTGKTTLILRNTHTATTETWPGLLVATNGGVSYQKGTYNTDTDETTITVYAVASPATLSWQTKVPYNGWYAPSLWGAMAAIQWGADTNAYPGPGLVVMDKTGVLYRLPAAVETFGMKMTQDGKQVLWHDYEQTYRWVLATGAVELISAANGT